MNSCKPKFILFIKVQYTEIRFSLIRDTVSFSIITRSRDTIHPHIIRETIKIIGIKGSFLVSGLPITILINIIILTFIYKTIIVVIYSICGVAWTLQKFKAEPADRFSWLV
ncbi:MAG: hypothetical protein DRQ03_03825, partial [Candidatus Hydrothermota bacterium]